ncbi:MAG TPA: hypothetical protein VFL56_06590, partial [Solirubrobacterales bacterium]|nr:hypothetical protein [Solirubrobacterales bacterium]
LFLGLIAAIAIAVGALMALREDGFEPLVPVPGGRTTSAAASPPVSTPEPEPTTEAPASTGQTASGPTKSGGSRSSSAKRPTEGAKE